MGIRLSDIPPDVRARCGLAQPEAPRTARTARRPRRRGSKLVDFAVTREPGAVTLTLPIQTVSEANQREHWTVKNARRAQQQGIVAMLIGTAHPFPSRPLDVVLTRLGPRRLDRDNASGSFKHVQDALASALGVDDGDEAKVSWDYRQERSPAYGVRVRIASRERSGEVS